ncbi:ATP-binding cassette domain-containing protein [Meiothermus sp.]|uniref:ATP-binding cassette domain-containing protein n=1 Tax=Meiothermus sp. TaxID=1955249 RepID=UPI00260A786A|nr:ATP-binding cassette domain-containing protein [Meiothermus sp.]
MTPLIELRKVSKYFGPVVALKDIDLKVYAGEVHCLLGDNGAGKSTLIKALSGVHPPSEGQILMEGEPVVFRSPRDALERGIATVYQDLAMLPLMSISRNFFLGREPKRKFGPFNLYDGHFAAKVAREEMRKIGIDIRDPDQPVGTLSGGERQSVAIARAVYFGAKVLILDEPTSALGVKESAVVLKYIVQAKLRGLGVIFITHNVHHAWAVGDTFTVLNRGRSYGTFKKAEVSREQLLQMMAGGEELEALSVELELIAKKDPSAAAQVEQRVAEDLHKPN